MIQTDLRLIYFLYEQYILKIETWSSYPSIILAACISQQNVIDSARLQIFWDIVTNIST